MFLQGSIAKAGSWTQPTGRYAMSTRTLSHRCSQLLFASIVALMGTFLPTSSGHAAPSQPVTSWVQRHAEPLDSVDPARPLDDLRPLASSVGSAEVVGLGEAVHGASELLSMRHRALRFLVEEMGFRTVAWEEQWTTGVKVDEYIRTGVGDLDSLIRQMSSQWQWHEVRDVLEWLRSYNTTHADQVRFVGVEYYLTWLPAYDAVESYVRETAPDRLPELLDLWAVVKPDVEEASTPEEHYQWYSAVADKSPYIDAAHAARTLIESVAHAPGDRAHDLALHNMNQIVAFYEHYAMEFDEQLVYRDARAAENLLWWRDRHPDHRIAYWAASPHTANAPELRLVTPWGNWEYPSAGSHLRERLGEDYLSVGFTFDHGAVHGANGPVALPPAEDHWFEHPLRDVRYEEFLVDLRHAAPPPVRAWLDGPITTRGLPDAGPDAYTDGGTLQQWFDVLVHRQAVSPAHGPNTS